MGQHADEFLPGIDFLLVELVADVLERHELVALLEQLERRCVQHELQAVIATLDAEQRPFAIVELLQKVRQPLVHTAERAHAVQMRHAEQAARGLVRHLHVALLVEADQGDADMFDDGLEVLMVRRLLPVQPSQFAAQQSIGVV